MTPTPDTQTAAPGEQHVAYPAGLVQAVLNYLGTKPHNEVRGLIDALAQGGTMVSLPPPAPAAPPKPAT